MTNPTDPTSQARDGNGQFVRTVETAERDARAARLRSEGKSYRAIAAELGVDVHTAHTAVQQAMAEIVAEPAAAAIAFELERLDAELVRLDDLYGKVVAVLEREHVTVSQGRVVTTDDGSTVPDDDWILKAVDRLVKIDESRRRNGESRRRLLGLDQPAKMAVSGGLTYEVVGIDTEALR
jgi:DNA-binding CsgD family transcriptional regulator